MTLGQRVLAISCGFEAATGLGLLVAPGVVASLVLGAEIVGPATIIGKIAGLALISLAIACWPRVNAKGEGAYLAMLIYNALVALLLAEAGASGKAAGMMLWPVVLTHLVFAALIGLASFGAMRGKAHQV